MRLSAQRVSYQGGQLVTPSYNRKTVLKLIFPVYLDDCNTIFYFTLVDAI